MMDTTIWSSRVNPRNREDSGIRPRSWHDEDLPPKKPRKMAENTENGTRNQPRYKTAGSPNGRKRAKSDEVARRRHNIYEESRRSNARCALRSNFKMLKEDMEPFQVTKQLKLKGIVDEKFYQTFRELRSVRDKVEALLIEVDRLLIKENSIHVYQVFLEALKDSDQDRVASLLQKPQFNQEKRWSTDDALRKHSFFKKAKDRIIATIDPRKFIDDIISCHGIDFQEYERIIKKGSREQMAMELYNLGLNNRFQIIMVLCDYNEGLYKEYMNEVTPPLTNSSREEGTPVTLRFNFKETVPSKASSEHTDMSREIKKVVGEIVNRTNDNPDQYGGLSNEILEKTRSILERVKLGSIVLHLMTSCDQSIKLLKECCRNGKAVEWLKSILKPEDIKKLQELNATDGSFECRVGDEDCKKKIFDEGFEECFCVLSKELIQGHTTAYQNVFYGLELDVINVLLESETLDETQASSLTCIKDSATINDMSQKLIEFLSQSQLKQSSFCFIEKKIRKGTYYRPLHLEQQHQLQLSTLSPEVQEDVEIIKENIKENAALLEEGLDSRWFLEYLKSRTDDACMKIVVVIRSLNSRKARTKPFVRFLCEEKDIRWFIRALDEYSPHLHALLTQLKDHRKLSVFRNAMLSVYDFIEDDVEPLELKPYLLASTLEQLNFSQCEKIDNRRERATFFMQQLMKAGNLDRIQDVMNAFSLKYIYIERVIKAVPMEGSFCEYYKCPRIEKHKMERMKLIYKGHFTLPQPNVPEHKEHLSKCQETNREYSPKPSSDGAIQSDLLSGETKHQLPVKEVFEGVPVKHSFVLPVEVEVKATNEDKITLLSSDCNISDEKITHSKAVDYIVEFTDDKDKKQKEVHQVELNSHFDRGKEHPLKTEKQHHEIKLLKPKPQAGKHQPQKRRLKDRRSSFEPRTENDRHRWNLSSGYQMQSNKRRQSGWNSHNRAFSYPPYQYHPKPYYNSYNWYYDPYPAMNQNVPRYWHNQ